MKKRVCSSKFFFIPLELVYDHELNIGNYGYHRQMHLVRAVSRPDFSIPLWQAVVQSVKIEGKNILNVGVFSMQ